MVELGVLTEDDRVELIEGELVVVSPQGALHSNLVVAIRRTLERVYGPAFLVRDHSPVVGTEDSLPEPDLAVVRGEISGFYHRLPGPVEIPLIVEVSYSTLGTDRRKANVYAKAGYATYWLVDVEARRLEVRTDPTPDGLYAKVELLGEEREIELPGTIQCIPIKETLPR